MGHRVLLAAVPLAVASPALATETSTDTSAGDESKLVFDLASDDFVVDEHTAQLLWNLVTDNIVPERIGNVGGWNSLYVTEPGTVSAQVATDLDTGIITGEIGERWACNNELCSRAATEA